MNMHKYINKIISKIKGESFMLDDRIPISYMLIFFINKFFCLLYGCLIFRQLSPIFVHPSSNIKCRSKIKKGRNFNIDRQCYIDALSTNGIIAGNNVSIGRFTTLTCSGSLNYLGEGIVIGDNVGLGTRGHYGCAGGIKIGSSTIIGDYVSMHSENHNFQDINTPIRLQGVNHKGIVIGDNCWIGAKVTILDGSKIGNGCVVAAGALVRSTFPDNCVIGGVPAKILKARNI